MDRLKGYVKKILKINEENGSVFAVVRQNTVNGDFDVKLSCKFLNLANGDYIIADGKWGTPSTYKGKTEEIFLAKSIRLDFPKDAISIESWFCSIFSVEKHGISKDMISKFILKYKDDSIKVIDENFDKIFEMCSNKSAFGNAIAKDWGRFVSNRKALNLMQNAGIEQKTIESILNIFKDSSYDVISGNPYTVAQIPSVGFPNADKIGNHIGISPDDYRRVKAAVLDVLRLNRSTGDTYLLISELVDIVVKNYSIDKKIAESYVLQAIKNNDGSFYYDKINDDRVVVEKELYDGEKFISSEVCARLKENPPSGLKPSLDFVLSKIKFKRFDDIQKKAIEMALTYDFSILTGGPGTGKSTVSEGIVDLAKRIGFSDIFLCAPTGKAAKRLEETTGVKSVTIHRLLEAREDGQTGKTIFNRNRTNPLPNNCFVLVDEASMIDIPTMSALLGAIPTNAKIVLVGDSAQLPSVDAGSVLGDLLKARHDGVPIVPQTSLLRVYRQSSDSQIAEGAALIRDGSVPLLTNKYDRGVVFYERPVDDVLDRIVWAINGCVNVMKLQPYQFAVLVPQAPGLAGTNEINRTLSKILNPVGSKIPGIVSEKEISAIVPRIGDRVMLTENDDEFDVMNGDIGTIVDAFEKNTSNGYSRPMMKILFDCGKTVEYPASHWRKFVLAYAITIHKSQGSQYEAVIMPVTESHHNMLNRSLFYTGWTRAKKSLFLVGQREELEYAIKNTSSSFRKTRLSSFIEEIKKIESKRENLIQNNISSHSERPNPFARFGRSSI